jgi:hypothetical protein
MAHEDAAVTRQVRTRRWFAGVLIALPMSGYFAAYFFSCERLATPDLRHVMPFRFLDHHRLVLTPKNLAGLFVPAAYAEAVLTGCWRGVLVSDRNGTTWDLTTNPWGFRRSVIDATTP